MRGKTEVVGIGLMNMDYIFWIQEDVSSHRFAISEYLIRPGGAAANTVSCLARLGIRSGFIGAVGDDDEGEKLIESFRCVGVDINHIRVIKGARTGASLCLVHQDGSREMMLLPGANRYLDASDTDMTYLTTVRAIHLGSLQSTRLQYSRICVLPSDIKFTFAPKLHSWAAIFEALANIQRPVSIFINIADAKIAPKGWRMKRTALALTKAGCETATVLRHRLGGPCGNDDLELCFVTSKNSIVQKRLDLKISDPIGATDAFAAGYIYGSLNGHSEEECADLGVRFAIYCLSHTGIRGYLPSIRRLLRVQA